MEHVVCFPKIDEILTACFTDYTGNVRYLGPLPGVGDYGGPLVLVEFIEHEDQPRVPVDIHSLVTRKEVITVWVEAKCRIKNPKWVS